MKGIILAGGEGLRLRPMTSKLPKPMVSLCGRPVMEHIILLLKRHGITEIAVTLGFLPGEIQSYFGDGSQNEVHLTYFTEKEPLGTAGAVAQCRSFIGTDTALVISGDTVCDFDLSAAESFHRKHHADVTVLLSKQENPLDYGLAELAHDGRIKRFREKPDWKQVFGDTVSTGIYLMKPEVLNAIPQKRPCDFAHDLFPEMLERDARIFGKVDDGYWCDIGDTEAYLRCMRDCMDERLELEPSAPVIRQGVRSWTPISDSYRIHRPCYIGKNVVIEHGAVLGPYAQIADNTHIGGGAVVQNSAVSGEIGGHATLYGAIVCEDAVIGNGAGLSEGCVIGGGAQIGEGAIVFENVRIFPGKQVEAGAHVRFHVKFNHFGDFSLPDVPTRYLMDFGSALASKGAMIALCRDASSEACAAMGALETGIRCAGSDAVVCDCRFAAAASFMSRLLKADFSLFVNQDRKIDVFDANGFPISSKLTRELETAVRIGGDASSRQVGRAGTLTGADEIYEASRIRLLSNEMRCMVFQNNEAGKSLANILKRSGANVRDKWRAGEPCYEISDSGYQVFARDESRNFVDARHMLALGVLCALKRGETRPIFVWDDLPHAIDTLVNEWGGTIIKAQGFGSAAESCDFLVMDGMGCLMEVIGFMDREELSLSECLSALPDFYVTETEIPLDNGRGEIMEQLSRHLGGGANIQKNTEDGVSMCLDGGWVAVRPSAFHRAVRVVSEAYTMEVSEELCREFEEKVKKLDNHGKIIQ